MHMASFSGVQVLSEVDPSIFAALYAQGQVPLATLSSMVLETYPNSFLVLKAAEHQSALVRISPDGKEALLIRSDLNACGVKPRNKEQAMALSTLLDDRVPVQVLAGKAGTGKTLLTLAAAMQKVDEGKYNKIILTKPMSQVGQYDLGILPGTIEEKFAPFLINISSNIEQLLGTPDPGPGKRGRTKEEKPENGLKGVMADFFQQYRVEMIPFQLLRGASFQKTFIIADEIQVLDYHAMLTLGTRVATGSKLVLMGDLDQRDEKIARAATGLHKVITDPKMLASGLVSYLELKKVERGPVAELFANVFEAPAG